jgi:2-polyprenyl-3-methyl-5-hydroxy-6-metoxy-1,4-benzoquinol methylase
MSDARNDKDIDASRRETERYYDLRAREYEAIYYRDDPARQRELRTIADELQRLCANRTVLEVACGTGYWTEIVASVAQRIIATDASADVLAVAGEKNLPKDTVELREVDAYRLDRVAERFDVCAALFWISHVPKSQLAAFLDGLHAKVGSGGIVFMADNFQVPGFGGELVERPDSPDTFKRRELSDGSCFDIIKNYFDVGDLDRLFSPYGNGLMIDSGKFYWWLHYRVK